MKLESRISARSADFQANREQMLRLIAELNERQARARQGGGPKAQSRMKERGKMLARERVEALLDPGTPFLELSPLAAFGMYNDESPAGSIITGIGVVSGRQCMVIANDPSVKGGAIYPMTLKKHLRAQQIARENSLPCITLVESAGANLLHQAEIFAELGGRVFANQARMSKARIPQVSLVFGSSTAGGAYIPGMSDYIVMVKNQARVFLGGPPLVKMATGEVVDEETLGGAEMHSRHSGLCDYLAEDDQDALDIGRSVMSRLSKPRVARSGPEPAYDPEELLGVVPADLRIPYDVREVIARIVDASEFLEFKARYGATLVAGHARIQGRELGILANNGVLFSESAQKGAEFIDLCNQSGTPILFLQNITGFMVGSRYEREGIVRHGSTLVNAVSTSEVPHITLIIGGSYGAGNYGMCGRAYDPRFLWTWPNSRIAVMGGEQAAGVLELVGEKDPARLAATRDRFEQESSPYFATARLWDDGILDPRHTRMALSVGLEAAC